ncbi:MAG TPA: SDR family oxidoreductase [Reyranella sp.]|nr:SDR family oxidoreductase [Reyranella sp.]
MRVFVTGASGWVGSAVVQELLSAGHTVIGLVRSDEAAAKLAAAGAEVLRGSMEDLDSLKTGAARADGVIHTAFNHDFSKFAANAALDRGAIEAIGSVLEGSKRPLLVTSGFARRAAGRIATEDDPAPPVSDSYPRASEQAAMALAERGVHASIVRLAPSVHGRGDHGFVPRLVALAREKGQAAYIDDGQNRWPGVHRLDAARLYRLALERGTRGERYHAAAEEGVPFKDIAGAIGKGLGLPVVAKTGDAISDHFGWFAGFAAMDMAASSDRTRKTLDWTPTHPGLLDDIAHAGYCDAGA